MLSFFSALPTPASHTCPKLLTSRPGASSLGRRSARSLTLVVSGASGLGQPLSKEGHGPSVGHPPTRTPLVRFNPTLPGSTRASTNGTNGYSILAATTADDNKLSHSETISMAVRINIKCSLLPEGHTTSLRSMYRFAFFSRKLFSNCWLFSNCSW